MRLPPRPSLNAPLKFAAQSSRSARPPAWAALSSATGRSARRRSPAHRRRPSRSPPPRRRTRAATAPAPRRRTRPGPRRTAAPRRPGAAARGRRARPTPPARQHSASATASPPSATSWAERSAPARTPWRTAACSVAQLAEVGVRAARRTAPRRAASPARSRSRAGAHEPAEMTATTSPSCAKPRRPERVGLRQLADQPDDRGREDRARRRPRCRARRCRRRPGSRARGRRRRGPATARVSCQATCGFSGLPKLRQLVSPSGSAPTQARLAEHSSTASTAPR